MDFNTYNLLEKHGVLSGENSCSKFASHVMDLMEYLDKVGVKEGSCILHSNKYSPEHEMNKNLTDFSSSNWDLPEWAGWELVLHYGKYEDNDDTDAAMRAGDLSAHLYVKRMSGVKFRLSYSATIQHEMKHYFDKVIQFQQRGENSAELTKEVNSLCKKVENMNDDEHQKSLMSYFSYFFYSTSDSEMSAWLEQSREKGIWTDLMKETKWKDTYKGNHTLYAQYKKVIESILLWKDDDSQKDKLSKVIELDDINTYDEFKKFMMDNYGKYLSLRFNQKASFEKYMKGYLKILDKQIKKHMKVWADGVQCIDLDVDEKDIKDILIQKREERLERIRKKKEGK